MTKQELETFEKELSSRGYKQYPAHNSAKYTWFKSFGESKYDEDRSNYQIAFSVWDFSEYAHRDNYLKENPYSVSPEVLVSRTIDERVDLALASTMVSDFIKRENYATNITEVERLADSFLKWTENNVIISKHNND